MNYPNYMKKYLLIYLAYFTLWSHSSINAQAFKYPKPKIVDQTDNYLKHKRQNNIGHKNVKKTDNSRFKLFTYCNYIY